MTAVNCYFIENSQRCREARLPFSNFCEKHCGFLKTQSNREIIKQLSIAVRNCVSITADKKIGAVHDKAAWIEFTNLFNELIDRGYEYHEVMLSIRGETEESGVFDDVLSEIGHDPKWKKFEKIVCAIHEMRLQGAEVKFNDSIVGKRTGRPRQIDISVRFNHGFYSYLILVECKDYNRKVPIGELEAFRTKIEDIGAQKGIMVSSAGFQAGAEETAKAYNIELFTLEEIKSDWTTTIRDISIKIPFPDSIEFDHMQCDTYPQHGISGPLKFHEVLIFRNQHEAPRSLTDICAELGSWVYSQGIHLPTKLNVKFEETRFLKIPSIHHYIPLYGLSILFVNFLYGEKKNIEIPPQIVSYRYTDTLKKTEHVVPAYAVREKINT